MMTDLSDDQKQRLAKAAAQMLEPLAAKHELDTASGRAALYEAFQLGIKFAYGEAKRIEEEIDND